MPTLAIREGFVVTPSKMPKSFASLICARSAVSMKNFMVIKFIFYRISGPLGGPNINKKRQVTYIAPLRPLTLAAFRPWGGSAGAGRIRLACHKDTDKRDNGRLKF